MGFDEMRLFVIDLWPVGDRFCEQHCERGTDAGGPGTGASSGTEGTEGVACRRPGIRAGMPGLRTRTAGLRQDVGSFADQAVTDSVPLSTS